MHCQPAPYQDLHAYSLFHEVNEDDDEQIVVCSAYRVLWDMPGTDAIRHCHGGSVVQTRSAVTSHLSHALHGALISST